MALDLLRRFLIFAGLCLGQVLVFNHIRLFGCAMPLLYVYFAIIIHRGYPRWATLLWCFTMGLAVDVFSNTPGVGAGAMTLVGFLQPYLLELFVPRDSVANLKSAMTTLGFARYTTFATILTFIFCITFYTLEMFSFFDVLQWMLNVAGSTVLTMVLLLAIERIRKP